VTNCPDIPADLVAYADQRIATTATFLDRMVEGERPDVVSCGSDSALAVCALSVVLDTHLTQRAALSDALALAIRRLAAR
jgi:hypothetical protein